MAYKTGDYVQRTVRAAAVLTDTYVAGTVLDATHEYNQLILLVSFTKASSTSMEWKVEFSPDGTNYYQESAEAISAGTATNRELEHTIVSANQSAAAQLYRFAIPITDRYIKVSVKATGTVTSTSVAVSAILGIN